MADGTDPRALNDRILEAWAAGSKSPDIAKWALVSAYRVRQIVRTARKRGDARAVSHDRGGSNPTWPVESIERLESLWASGLSCTRIAAVLGRTKGSIIGKVHRLNLTPRATSQREISRMGGHATSVKRKRGPGKIRSQMVCDAGLHLEKPTLSTIEMALQFTPHDTKPVPLMERTDRQCSWIAGETAGPLSLCCGAPVIQRSWCAYHWRLGHYRNDTQERRAKLVKSLMTGAFA